MNKKIVIKKPYVVKNGSLHRLHADVYEDGALYQLFVEVEEEYARFLCPERSDAFVYLTLPVAVRGGYDIYCEAPVTEQFLHNVNEILIPHLVRGDKRLHPATVYAPSVYVSENAQGGVGTAISCGVDSMYTIMEYTNKKYQDLQLTHFVITPSSIDLKEGTEGDLYKWEEKYQKSFDRYREASRLFKLPLVKIYSNFYTYLCIIHKFRHITVHHYMTMADVLAVKKLWKVYLFSSSVDFMSFQLRDNSVNDTDKHELLSMHVLSTPDFSCFSSGAKADRIEKTAALAEYPPARALLHPCFNHERVNCSKPGCNKCLRALLTLDYYDKLDSMREVFHVDEYRRNRREYLYQLTAKRENEFLKKLYEMFLEKYPEDMKQVMEDYEKNIATVARAEFDTLMNAYNVTLALCSLDNPKSRILDYFKSQGIHTLYCAGSSRLGTKVLSFISHEIACMRKGEIEPASCDAALILFTHQTRISNTARELEKLGAEKIFNLYDMERTLREPKEIN